MAPRNLSTKASLEAIWEEVQYTRSRCLGDPDATDLALPFEQLVAEVEETKLGQQRRWAGEIDAQASCDYWSGRLGELVVDLANTLVFVIRDRRSPRVKLYLTRAPHAIARMALKSEVEVVRFWPRSLETEPEEELRAFAPRLTEAVCSAQAALLAQRVAQSARADHRVRVIVPTIDRINQARLKLYGQLVGRAQEKRLGRHWPDGFFKVAQRRSAAGPVEEAPEERLAVAAG